MTRYKLVPMEPKPPMNCSGAAQAVWGDMLSAAPAPSDEEIDRLTGDPTRQAAPAVDAEGAAKEIVAYVSNIVRPWVAFYGHEPEISAIIHEHTTAPKPTEHVAATRLMEEDRAAIRVATSFSNAGTSTPIQAVQRLLAIITRLSSGKE